MPRPDRVLWITTDHMRYDGVAANGNPHVHTPALDALAAGGVSFDRCFCQSPLCMPSRCSFMTGLYPQQTGVTSNGRPLPPGTETTVARCFRRGDYDTVQIGKLHFDNHEDMDLRATASPDYGFDTLWLAEEPGPYEDAYMTWLRTEHPDLVEMFRVPRSLNPERRSGERARVLDAPWEASFSGWVVQQAERYLSAFGGMTSNQFLHLGFYAPHPPLNPTREMMAPYEGRELPLPVWRANEADDKPPELARALRARADWPDDAFRRYRAHFYGMITGIDLAVGRLVAHLRGRQLLDNTLIVFSSDHGDHCGDHRMILKDCTFYDGLMRLPLILHWPAGLGAAPRRIGGIVEMVDVLPTLLDLCGIPVPRVMAGRSLAADLLAGREPAGREDAIATHDPGHLMLRTATHKYVRWASGGEVLFDLERDPGEFVNVARDPAYREVRGALVERMLDRSMACSRSAIRRTGRF